MQYSPSDKNPFVVMAIFLFSIGIGFESKLGLWLGFCSDRIPFWMAWFNISHNYLPTPHPGPMKTSTFSCWIMSIAPKVDSLPAQLIWMYLTLSQIHHQPTWWHCCVVTLHILIIVIIILTTTTTTTTTIIIIIIIIIIITELDYNNFLK